MEKIIQTLLDAYDSPVLLSDAQEKIILHSNAAMSEILELSKNEITGLLLNDLLGQKKIINNQEIWKQDDEHYYIVNNEELTLAGTTYIKTHLESLGKGSLLFYTQFQKEMARRLVHRLRSPLNGILGFTELLQKHSLSSKKQQYVHSIKKGLLDLKSILSDIEILGQTVTVVEHNISILQLAEQIKASFPPIRQKQLDLVFDKGIGDIKSDPVLLTSIIKEFLQNSFQHCKNKQAVVTLHFKEDRIRIHNEGSFIPDSLAPHIFYPFFSGKAQTMGIGLAKCAYFANHIDVDLKLAQNSSEDGVSFDIIFKE